VTDVDIAKVERAAFIHAMAGLDGLLYPLWDCWPGPPGRAYVYEMLRRDFGTDAIEYVKTLPLMTQH
jgi:hypothetical protein